MPIGVPFPGLLIVATTIAAPLLACSLIIALSPALMPPILPSALLVITSPWRSLGLPVVSPHSWARGILRSGSRLALLLVWGYGPLLTQPFVGEIRPLDHYAVADVPDDVDKERLREGNGCPRCKIQCRFYIVKIRSAVVDDSPCNTTAVFCSKVRFYSHDISKIHRRIYIL